MPRKIEIPDAFRDLFVPARYKAFYGGRGSAKSHSFAKALLIQGSQFPLRVLCGREVQQSIKDSVKQLLDDQIGVLGWESIYESTRDEIRHRNGTTFIFAGLGRMTTDQIKSMEGIDRVWIEEAQTISANSLEILIPTIRKKDSELWFSWNPRHSSDPVDQRFRGEAIPPRAIVRRVNYTDNPFFPDELEEERAWDHQHNPTRYAHIWLGEYEPQAVGAIWDMATINEHRRARENLPEFQRVVVAIDPAGSSEKDANETGIVAAALGEDGRGYVLDDVSLAGQPDDWVTRALAAYDLYEADAIVAETNYGGAMVAAVVRAKRPGTRVIEVRATRGKHVRAEPIAALYSLGRISHAGAFPKLEAQMCLVTAGGYEGEGSPDRMDAMVWAFTELFPKMTKKTKPRDFIPPSRANNNYSPHRWRA